MELRKNELKNGGQDGKSKKIMERSRKRRRNIRMIKKTRKEWRKEKEFEELVKQEPRKR